MKKIDIIKMLAVSFPTDKIGEGTVLVYLDNLKDISDAMLEYGARHCLQTCKFFPSIAEIREACRYYKDTAGPKPVKPWAEVEHEIREAIRHHGFYNPPEWSTPELNTFMKDRWRLICEMEIVQEATVFAQMRMAWEGMSRTRKSHEQIAETVAMLPLKTQVQLEEKIGHLVNGIREKLGAKQIEKK